MFKFNNEDTRDKSYATQIQQQQHQRVASVSPNYTKLTLIHGCSSKQVIVKILQYSQENNCVGVSF